MKRHICFIFLLVQLIAYGQIPQKMNYQAIARNNKGIAFINQNIAVKITIHDSSAIGIILFQEVR